MRGRKRDAMPKAHIVEVIREMRGCGYGHKRIADRLGYSVRMVKYYCEHFRIGKGYGKLHLGAIDDLA